jgi:hypothetical protein
MSYTEALYNCGVDVLNALEAAGLDEDAIASVCYDGGACSDAQSCLNGFL